MYTLFLGSNSSSRKQLLLDAKIPFCVIGHTADETACNWNLPLQELVTSIALSKMEHVVLPPAQEQGACLFVATADTLSRNSQGQISGKPTDYEDARKKVKEARQGMYTGTAFCLDKRVWVDGAWQLKDRIVQFVGASYSFTVPDEWIDTYLKTTDTLSVSGAIAIEGYGGLFLQSVQGSYTTIVGLPLYEFRQALEQLHFF